MTNTTDYKKKTKDLYEVIMKRKSSSATDKLAVHKNEFETLKKLNERVIETIKDMNSKVQILIAICMGFLASIAMLVSREVGDSGAIIATMLLIGLTAIMCVVTLLISHGQVLISTYEEKYADQATEMDDLQMYILVLYPIIRGNQKRRIAKKVLFIISLVFTMVTFISFGWIILSAI